MQKFVVKKSKSAPLASSSSGQQPVVTGPTLSPDEKTVPQNAATTKPSPSDSVAVCASDVTAKQPVKSVTPTTASSVKMSGYLKKKRNVSTKSAVDIVHPNVKHIIISVTQIEKFF